MKQTQKGFIGAALIIAVIVLAGIAGSVAFVAKQRKNVENRESAKVKTETSSRVSSIDSNTEVDVSVGSTEEQAPVCDEIIGSLRTALLVNFGDMQLQFAPRYGTRLCAYHVFLTGTEDPGGNHFAHAAQVALESDGWKRNSKYDADGVRGGEFLMEKNGLGVTIGHQWKNMDEQCPDVAGGPIAMCNPLPAEQLFEMTVDIQRK